MQAVLVQVRVLLCLLLAAFVAYGLSASTWGLSSDNDAELLMHASQHLAASGEYVRSRTSGFPLYECLVAAFIAAGLGVQALNLLSFLMAMAALALAGSMMGRSSPARSALAPVLLLTYPVFVIAGTETMETMLSVLLALLLVSLSLKHPRLDVRHALVAVLLVLARLDAALLVIAIASAATWRGHSGPIRAGCWLALTGLLCLALYAGINHGLGFLDTQALGLDGILRRLVRAAAGIVNGFQPVVWVGLALLLWQHRFRRDALPREPWQTDLLTITLIASVLYGLRFLALPDEIFYLAIPGCLWLLVIASRVNAGPGLALLLAVGMLQCLLSVSLFVRVGGEADTLRVAPALNPGPLFQERSQRLAFAALRDADRLKALSCHFYPDCPALSIDHTAPFLVTADGQRVLVSDRYRYVFFSDRYPSLRDGAYREAIVCDEEVVPSVSGWRVWQPAIPAYLTDVLADGGDPHCRTVSLR